MNEVRIEVMDKEEMNKDITMEERLAHVLNTPNIVKCEKDGKCCRVWQASNGKYKVFFSENGNGGFATYDTLEAAMEQYHKAEQMILVGAE